MMLEIKNECVTKNHINLIDSHLFKDLFEYSFLHARDNVFAPETKMIFDQIDCCCLDFDDKTKSYFAYGYKIDLIIRKGCSTLCLALQFYIFK